MKAIMARPLNYYNDLRSKDLPYEKINGSRVILIKPPEEGGESIRLIHISQFALISIPGFSGFTPFGMPIRVIFGDVALYWEAGAFAAAKHFNDRDDSIVPGLSERLKGCDLHLTLDMVDTQMSSIVASRHLYEQFTRENSLQTPIPSGIVGAFSSTTTQPLAVLAGSFATPHVGAVSSADLLDEKDVYPTFLRTNPSNKAYARASIELFQYWGITRVACIYARSEYGISIFQYFLQEATRAGLQVVGAGYKFGGSADNEAIIEALAKVKASGFRYIMGVLNQAGVHLVLEPAVDMGLIGDDFQWVITQAGPVAEDWFQLPIDRLKFATALNGVASVEIETPSSPAFFNEMRALSFDMELQDFFVDSHTEPFLYDGFKWNETFPILSSFTYTGYDALMALGISACEAEQDFFTGLEHLEQLKKTTFDGASGPVAFDPETGTRTLGGFKYIVTNILVDFNSTQDGSGFISFQSRPSLEVNFTRPIPVNEITPYVFSNGNTTRPEELPPLGEEDLNLMANGVQIFGWTLAAVLMLISVCFGLYTIVHRREKLIRASQPIFLGMLCTGTFIMGAAIVPMSLQEPTEGLDIACISTPWLVTLGFSTAFSALFTKTWRINSVFRQSMAMQRKGVTASDVIWPFTILTCANVIILTTWTIMSPLEYQRNELDSKDQFGRSIESYGACHDSGNLSPIFLLLLAVFNFLAVVLANYQSFIGRNVPSEFNESFYITISMTSILECFIIGAPIVIFVRESPSADFVVKSLLLFCTSMAILLPLFMPKITARNAEQRMDMDALHSAMAQHSSTRWSKSRSRDSQSREFTESSSAGPGGPILPSSVAQLRASAAASTRRMSAAGTANHQRLGSIEQYEARFA